MRIRNSIAIPIVFVLLAIAVGILAAGYFINRGVFYDVFEERESNKAGNIRLTITSLISGEMGRIAGLSKVLGKDTDVYYGLYHYGVTKGDLKPLKTVMEQLQAQANLQIFSMRTREERSSATPAEPVRVERSGTPRRLPGPAEERNSSLPPERPAGGAFGATPPSTCSGRRGPPGS